MEEQRLQDGALSFMKPLMEMTGLGLAPCCLLLLFGVVIALHVANTVFDLMTEDNGPRQGRSGVSSSTRGRKREKVLLVGPVNAGKTRLFYRLLSQVNPDTVSSTSLNKTDSHMEVKIPKSVAQTPKNDGDDDIATCVTSQVDLIDIPGHFNFRSTINQSLDQAKAIILVLDSSEKDKFGEAADILYDVLGNIDIIGEQVPVLVACNKQDLTFAKKAVQLERLLESEID
jgi:small GTP-binding protein